MRRRLSLLPKRWEDDPLYQEMTAAGWAISIRQSGGVYWSFYAQETGKAFGKQTGAHGDGDGEEGIRWCLEHLRDL